LDGDYLFENIFNEVKEYFITHGGEDDDRGFTFRKRSEHTWRVFTWAQRLSEGYAINNTALLIAALFHDIGVTKSLNDHANQGALIFREYAANRNYDENQIDFIEYLIRNHSNKELLAADIPLELILLLEADMLDETGAHGVIWDAMMAKDSYVNAYELLKSHSCDEYLPMRTPKAREIWENKQNLIKEFIKQLKYDLVIDD